MNNNKSTCFTCAHAVAMTEAFQQDTNCLVLTAGHGSNIRGLESTATFVRDSDEFELHSPTLTSTKWFVLYTPKYIYIATLFIKTLLH